MGLIVGVFGAILQLIFGLLMLSAAAPTSMAEERQRGSLDLLAATTLSTPTIVLGKWLATLRQVALLAIGPGLLGLALALAVKAPQTIPLGTPARYYEELSDGALLFGACLLITTILAHGALIASVGLALAVWIAPEPGDRPERGTRGDRGRRLADPRRGHAAGHGQEQGLACLSPVVAVFQLIGVVTERRRLGATSSGGSHSGTSSAWRWPWGYCG